MASGHLVAHGDLPLLGDVDPDHLVDVRRKLVGIFTGEYLDIHNNAVFAVGNLQGGVPHLSGLFAEDGPQQAFLRDKLGLALGGDLAHQDIAGAHLRAYADNAVFVQVDQGVLGDVGDIPGNLLRAQLGVAGFQLVFFNVNGRVSVLTDNSLVDEDRVLVVIPLPGGKANQHILAQADFAVAGGGAVGNDLALFHPFALGDNGPLVDAGPLVGALDAM